MLGVNIGLGSLHLLMGLGLGAVFLNFPLLQQVLKVMGSGYLLLLAWKMFGISMVSSEKTDIKKPMTVY